MLTLNLVVLHLGVETNICYNRELEKIEVEGEDLYLPTAPNKLVRGIRVDSGIPLQSAAKVPIMITFNVVDRDGDHSNIKPQACIFKVSPLSLKLSLISTYELRTKNHNFQC